MTQTTGSPPLYLVTSTPEMRSPPIARDVVVQLETCRALLVQGGHTETVQLLDIVVLQLRMQLRGVSEAELQEFCEALSERSPNPERRDADGA